MARCQWCTAPLPSGASLCRYCGRRSDVDLRGVHEFTVVEPASPRICPVCGIPMQSVDLHLGGTFFIERCERCLSLFFDPNEIETVVEQSASGAFQVDLLRLGELAARPVGGRAATRYYACPVCSTAMNRVNFGARSGVIVDQCPKHGVWLEGGELRRLLEWRRAGGQILDRQRRVERLEEEQKAERKRAREEARVRAEDPPRMESEHLVNLPDPTEAVRAFVRTVLGLFR